MGEFKKVTVRKDTKEKLDQICKVLGKTKAGFLSELIENVWEIAAFQESSSGNVEYSISVLGNYAQIQFNSQSRIRIGETKAIEGESLTDETRRLIKGIEEGKSK